MNDLCLHFCDTSRPDLPLDTGVLALGRSPTGLAPMASDGPWLLQLCNDRRGIWLTVAEGLRGVHVNGRPVLQLAMLRAGDSVHVDGMELLLRAANDAQIPVATNAPHEASGNPRMVLRGVGGVHHGRSLSLEKPRWIGSAINADLRIEGHGITSEHARVEVINGQPVLRQAAAAMWVNGWPLQQAALRSGDQITFGNQHRFVLEGPPLSAAPSSQRLSLHADADAAPVPPTPRWQQRVPWLLVAALLLASALWVLLVFGAR